MMLLLEMVESIISSMCHCLMLPATREEILRISMRKRSVSEDFDFRILAEKTEGYSGAEKIGRCF